MSTGDKQRVVKFFAMLKVVYGAARYAATWDSEALETAAMKLWAPDILRYTDVQLSEKLAYAKGMSYLQEWRFPDVGLILRGDRQAGASGQAALSYKPASEVLALQNKPTSAVSASGQAFLDDLRGDLDKDADKRKESLTAAYSEAQVEVDALVEKHLPYGYYQQEHVDDNGQVFYRVSDRKHPAYPKGKLGELTA